MEKNPINTLIELAKSLVERSQFNAQVLKDHPELMVWDSIEAEEERWRTDREKFAQSYHECVEHIRSKKKKVDQEFEDMAARALSIEFESKALKFIESTEELVWEVELHVDDRLPYEVEENAGKLKKLLSEIKMSRNKAKDSYTALDVAESLLSIAALSVEREVPLDFQTKFEWKQKHEKFKSSIKKLDHSRLKSKKPSYVDINGIKYPVLGNIDVRFQEQY